MAAPNPAAAAMARDQRGPKVSAAQPTMGAPMGVPPTAMARRIAMTRPRMAGSVVSWMVLFDGGGEGLGGDSDEDEGEAEEPVVWHESC